MTRGAAASDGATDPGAAQGGVTGASADVVARAAAALAGAHRLLLTCHLRPDGDSAGSLSALASLLRAAGKKVVLYNPDPVPRHLRWLPHLGHLVHKLAPDARFDLTVVVDCGDRVLLGDRFPVAEVTGPVLSVDHHAAGKPFGDIVYGDPGAASVGVLVARLAAALGWPLTADTAPGLYVSLVSDTGFFRYANSNGEAFALAAELVGRLGVDPWAIAERLSEHATRERYKLLARALDGLEVVLGGRVAIMTVTEALVRESGASWADSEGLVNYARALEGVEVGVLLTPATNGGGTRVSLRSRGHIVDAGAVCLALGGGGHRGAAGCRVATTDLAEARAQVIAALEAALAAPAPAAPAPAETPPAA